MMIAFHTYSVDPKTNVYTRGGAADERVVVGLSNFNGDASGHRPRWDHPATEGHIRYAHGPARCPTHIASCPRGHGPRCGVFSCPQRRPVRPPRRL